MNEKSIFSQLNKLLVQIKKDRKDVLDILEVAVGNSAKWETIRSKVMNTFGRDGLEGTVRQIIESQEGQQNEL